jgi:hypothetical protein
LLYGGDSSDGQLAILDPATGVRTDFNVAGLPASVAFGGSWFNAAGELFIYRNNGEIYEIDLAGPTVVGTQSGPSSGFNDGAACVPDVGPAPAVSGGTGTTVSWTEAAGSLAANGPGAVGPPEGGSCAGPDAGSGSHSGRRKTRSSAIPRPSAIQGEAHLTRRRRWLIGSGSRVRRALVRCMNRAPGGCIMRNPS